MYQFCRSPRSSTVLGVEFETAVMWVDFEEIKAVKESAEKWPKMSLESRACG